MEKNPTRIVFTGKTEGPASFTQLCHEWRETMKIMPAVTTEVLFLESNPDVCLAGIREAINV